MGDATASDGRRTPSGRLSGRIDALSTLVRDAFHAVSAPDLGWSFLLAWVFCVFYVSAVDGFAGRSGQGGLASQLFFTSFPLFAAVVTLMVIVHVERRHGAPSTHPALRAAAPVLCTAGTPLMFLSDVADARVAAAAFGVGAVATGIGSGLLWIMWGERYAMMNRDEAELLAPASGVVAVALILLVTATSGWVGLAMVSSFPLICGVCLRLTITRAAGAAAGARATSDLDLSSLRGEHRRAAQAPLGSLRMMGRSCLGILACCVVVCVMGATQPADTPQAATPVGLMLGGLLSVLVALMATSHPRSVTAAFLLRWLCPLLIVGLGCVSWLPGAGGLAAVQAISLASRLLLCVFTQMYFALIASAGRVTPTQAYGYGWIAVHLGDWVGVVLVIVTTASCGAGTLLAPAGVTLLMACLATVTMAVLGRADADALGDGSAPRATGGRSDARAGAPSGAATAGRRGDVDVDGRDARGGEADADGGAGASAEGRADASGTRGPARSRRVVVDRRAGGRRAWRSSRGPTTSRRARPRCSACSHRAARSPTSATRWSSRATRPRPT